MSNIILDTYSTFSNFYFRSSNRPQWEKELRSNQYQSTSLNIHASCNLSTDSAGTATDFDDEDQTPSESDLEECAKNLGGCHTKHAELLRSLLSATKQCLVHQIMEEFWVMFHCKYAIKLSADGHSEKPAESRRGVTASTKQTGSCTEGRKRRLEQVNEKGSSENDHEDDDCQGPKRPKISTPEPKDRCLVL